ncbi:putative disease resistance protein-like [Capsicum annuum]|nr:putative disease resistance protein-like [Capsicum annuum]
MEIVVNAVGGIIVEVGKFVSKCIYPKIENIVRFSSRIENLRKEMEKLTKFRDDIKEKVEGAEGEGYKPKPDVIKWIEVVHELEKEWESMQESIAAAKTLSYKCCPKCSLRSEISTQSHNIRDQLCSLIEVGQNFGSNLVVENYQMKKVEFIPGTSIEGQSAATRNLNKLLRLLEDDEVCIIGVWGTGGVGKTTLVKNLNNELLKNVSSSKLSFGVVVWVTVPKPPIDIRKIQAQIASRLNLQVDNEASVESIAGKIYQRLKKETSFLLILDDVWEAVNLDDVGVPQPEYPAIRKRMKIWQLLVKNAGDVANLEYIQQLAKEIARECGGLPLAITVIGSSMRGKTRVELWEDALKSLRMSEPHNKDVEKKVYMVIKWSLDSLESQDIELASEQRSKNVNKKRGDIQSCFLYCSLYPAAIPIDDLILCWWAEGILGEHDTYEQAYNRGITLIESLKDACLLEADMMEIFTAKVVDCVKMHDVVRDVAIWIASTFGDEHTSVIQAGIGLTEISHIKISASVKRISFVSNEIEYLPDCFTKCPKITSLLLQDNEPLKKISQEFFLAFPALRVLNLSLTSITELPSSINSLCQLRTLILQSCFALKELPPVANLHNLQVLDCDNTVLRCLPQGMDNLTNLRLLNMLLVDLKSTNKGFFLKLPSIEMLDLSYSAVGATSFEEISSLQNLTYLSIKVDSSYFSNRDYTWMTRLKGFLIEVGETLIYVPYNKSMRAINVYKCEIFSNGELSGMLQFASDLFSKLHQLDISQCASLTCLFNDGGACSVPKHLEEITIRYCRDLVDLFVQCNSSDQATLINSEIPRVRKLTLYDLAELRTLGQPQSMWEHLEELIVSDCDGLRKLPLSIQTSKNIKIIKGTSEWWSQLEWDDGNFKSNLEHC